MSVLAEKSEFFNRRIARTPFKLEQLFPKPPASIKKKGIQLQFDLQNTLDPRIAILKQSETLFFLNQLFFKEGQSLEQICQVLSTNQEHIQEIIHRINTKLPQHYGVNIQPSPLVMEGEEEDIRAFLSRLL